MNDLKKLTIKERQEIYFSMIGKTFCYITIIEFGTNLIEDKKYRFKVICICKKEFYPTVQSVITGRTKSCGCKRYDFIANAKMTRSALNNNSLIGKVFYIYEYYAIKRNISFELTKEDISKFIFENCYYCGGGLSNKYENNGSGKNKIIILNAWNGIDRKNNDLGYSIENCVPCCQICNYAKRNLSFDDWNSYIERICLYNGYIKY